MPKCMLPQCSFIRKLYLFQNTAKIKHFTLIIVSYEFRDSYDTNYTEFREKPCLESGNYSISSHKVPKYRKCCVSTSPIENALWILRSSQTEVYTPGSSPKAATRTTGRLNGRQTAGAVLPREHTDSALISASQILFKALNFKELLTLMKEKMVERWELFSGS